MVDTAHTAVPKNSTLTLLRDSGERGSGETNMMTSLFKNERAGPDGANMCSRREPRLSYAPKCNDLEDVVFCNTILLFHSTETWIPPQ